MSNEAPDCLRAMVQLCYDGKGDDTVILCLDANGGNIWAYISADGRELSACDPEALGVFMTRLIEEAGGPQAHSRRRRGSVGGGADSIPFL